MTSSPPFAAPGHDLPVGHEAAGAVTASSEGPERIRIVPQQATLVQVPLRLALLAGYPSEMAKRPPPAAGFSHGLDMRTVCVEVAN